MKKVLLAQAALLGPQVSVDGTTQLALLQSWPFFKKIFVGNQANQIMPMLLLPGTLPSKLQKSPAHLTDFVEKCLQWHPDARMTVASASN